MATLRCWFSGRMPAFQAGDKSSILLRRTKNLRSKVFCGCKKANCFAFVENRIGVAETFVLRLRRTVSVADSLTLSHYATINLWKKLKNERPGGYV